MMGRKRGDHWREGFSVEKEVKGVKGGENGIFTRV
jgi:hypothetical protein